MSDQKHYSNVKNTIKKVIPKALFKRTVNYFHLLESVAAIIRYGWPARGMKFIGVTGTNGKTSTTYMVATILEQAGYKAGMSSTAIIKDGVKTFENNLDGGLTNPGPFTMHKLLKTMRGHGVKWVAMESASQALDQHRLFGLSFRGAVITNLTNEHLDYHGTMERYAHAKGRLFRKNKGVSVVNVDDEWGSYFASLPAKKTVHYGKNGDEYQISDVDLSGKTTNFTLTVHGQSHPIKLKLQGEFNVYNAVAAIAVTHEVGVDLAVAIQAVSQLERIPGRMDAVDAGQPFKVIVDYAHTPDAIENVLRAARAITKGKLYCITGAAGERPLSRRAPVGKLASEIADVLMITDDEPFGEDPKQIRDQIRSGVAKTAPAKVLEQPVRAKAMAEVFALAKKGDTVVIAGMGHQKYRSGPNGKEDWDDLAVAEAALHGKQHKHAKNWQKLMQSKGAEGY